jgi:DNA-binding GntR family transcriptional regulator
VTDPLFIEVNKMPRSTEDDSRLQGEQLMARDVPSMSTVITSRLRRAILENRLKPGSRLLQTELASDLGVSRQPVREALRALEAEGLVMAIPGGGVRIRALSQEEITENYVLRRLLESEAAYAAATALSDEGILQLEQVHAEFAVAVEANDETGVLRHNAEFHRLICEGSAMPQLVRCVDLLWIGVSWPGGLGTVDRGKYSILQHEQIIASLKSRDPDAAKAAMHTHMRAAEAEHNMTLRRAERKVSHD